MSKALMSALVWQVSCDLDPALSPHHLTTHKAAYLKLRFLVDAGAIFVGHGLKKDFRMLNIVVPPAQAWPALSSPFCYSVAARLLHGQCWVAHLLCILHLLCLGSCGPSDQP